MLLMEKSEVPGHLRGYFQDAGCGRCFVCAMVAVFREVRRVLRDDGVVFLNLGDSYASGEVGRHDSITAEGVAGYSKFRGSAVQTRRTETRLASGNLVGVPWRVALALQADGWVLRQDVVWSKKSPMPESVRNRCTKAHEYVFLLAKRQGYFYDAEAVKEPTAGITGGRQLRAICGDYGADPTLTESLKDYHKGGPRGGRSGRYHVTQPATANKRSVWAADDPAAVLRWLAERYPDAYAEYLADAANRGDVWRLSSEAYPGAHFATFPTKLVEPCVKAGTSERGCCVKCGAPWRRVVETGEYTNLDTPRANRKAGDPHGDQGASASGKDSGINHRGGGCWPSRTVGWEPTCTCHGRFVPRKVWRPGVGTAGAAVFHGGGKESGGNRNDDGRGTNARDPATEGGRWETVYDYVCECGVSWAYERNQAVYQPEVVAPGVRHVDQSRMKGDGRRKLSGADYNHANAIPTTEREDPCDCYRDRVRPCLVLDPFTGSGTTNAVCLKLGRRSWGIDLSAEYLAKNAVPRVEGVLLSDPSTAWLAGRRPAADEGGDDLPAGEVC
jgi:hypothetical protein